MRGRPYGSRRIRRISPHPSFLTIQATAKVNLGLAVLRKRQDGYHEIRTIFHRITLADRISVRSAREPHFETSPPLPHGENLAYRALQILEKKEERTFPVRLSIEKRIPLGSGLGGGSSDAAAVLRVLNRLYRLGLRRRELLPLGRTLGSDVPFFLLGRRAAIGRGRGDELFPIPSRLRAKLLLYFPDYPIQTVWAYAQLEKQRLYDEEHSAEAKFEAIREALRVGSLKDLALRLENTFEAVIFEHYPDLKEAKRRLLEAGALGASLAGSGSALFGIFKEKKDLPPLPGRILWTQFA